MSSPRRTASDIGGRIPSLDGLRALSITLVLVSHSFGTPGSPIPSSFDRRIDLGLLGVRTFFVISGFLITGMLLRERAATGDVALRRFYFRRTLRIGLPFAVFLAVVALLIAAGLVAPNAGDFARAATYTGNYVFLGGDGPWLAAPLGHTWSLAVEEQFYLLWPAIIVLARPPAALAVAAAFVLAAPGIRYFAMGFPVWRAGHYTAFEQVGDALAMGCLLAGLRGVLWRSRVYRAALASRPAMLAVLAVVLLAGAVEHERPRAFALLGATTVNAGLALLLDHCVRHPHVGVGRLLNSRPLVALGVMSYSVYLYQQLFLHGGVEQFQLAFPYNILLAVTVGAAAYHLVERPTFALRRFLEERGRPSPAGRRLLLPRPAWVAARDGGSRGARRA